MIWEAGSPNYFSDGEQACPCCGVIKLAPGFLEALNNLRETCRHAMTVNSMCRCEKHNQAVGGKPGSYHLVTHPWGCCAADISTAGWPGWKKWQFIEMAMQRGFSIGFAQTFIHLDRRHIVDRDWPKPAFFTY
jgi:hypothetical protein